MKRVPRWVRRPEERPQELLDAAIDVFSTHGYRAARLDQVAEAAGVTKGAIYHYFTNKEELLTQALQLRTGTIFDEIEREGRRSAGTGPERLRLVLRAAWERWRMPQTARLHRLLMGELRTELPALFDAAMRAGPMRIWGLVATILEDGQRHGEFRADFPPAAAARFIVSGLMHQALLQADLDERGIAAMPPDEIFETAMTIALRGASKSA